MTDSYGFAEPIEAAQTKIARLKLELEAAEEELAKLELGQSVATFLNQDQRTKQLTNELLKEVDLSQFPGGIPLHIAWNSELRRFEVDVESFLTRNKDHRPTAQDGDLPNARSDNHQYRRRQRVRRNGRPPQEEDYFIPILKALKHFGWSATPEQITPLVLEQIRHRLTRYDFERIPSGTFIRWEGRMRFARKRMVMNNPPLLNPDSPKGIWEATDEGRRFLGSYENKDN